MLCLCLWRGQKKREGLLHFSGVLMTWLHFFLYLDFHAFSRHSYLWDTTSSSLFQRRTEGLGGDTFLERPRRTRTFTFILTFASYHRTRGGRQKKPGARGGGKAGRLLVSNTLCNLAYFRNISGWLAFALALVAQIMAGSVGRAEGMEKGTGVRMSRGDGGWFTIRDTQILSAQALLFPFLVPRPHSTLGDLTRNGDQKVF